MLDTVSDEEMPVLQSMSLSATAVDVRSASMPITATIHVTDDLAGATDVYLCPAHAFPHGTPTFRQAGACVSMDQSSGTPTDSTWGATYVVPKGAPSGTWNFQVWISDAADNAPNDYWFGPDELAAIGPTNEARHQAIPDGAGVFSVEGTPQGLNAPVLTSLDLPDNPTWTDTVDVAWVQNFRLVRGAPQDGVRRATLVVPGGTPDGSYFIQVALEDSLHFESWVSPDSGWTTDNQVLTPELAPTGDHFVIADS